MNNQSVWAIISVIAACISALCPIVAFLLQKHKKVKINIYDNLMIFDPSRNVEIKYIGVNLVNSGFSKINITNFGLEIVGFETKNLQYVKFIDAYNAFFTDLPCIIEPLEVIKVPIYKETTIKFLEKAIKNCEIVGENKIDIVFTDSLGKQYRKSLKMTVLEFIEKYK